ncbi:hypothetical protein B0A54_11170 [Friedmanniomyces endolithicus]|uniref:Secreted protein n=1 Tax=Friedmanniomyces endolithicus TaxID=329885 RepID=A0A4U0USV1_9PEZI|nr:hypothetical protein B0A54_11170 [Friedmanniomyces endolithicus]
MHSLVKLLAVSLAVGQNQFGNAVPVDTRSCEINEAVGLSLQACLAFHVRRSVLVVVNDVHQALLDKGDLHLHKRKVNFGLNFDSDEQHEPEDDQLQLIFHPVLIQDYVVIYHQSYYSHYFEHIFVEDFILDDYRTQAHHIWPIFEHHLIEDEQLLVHQADDLVIFVD